MSEETPAAFPGAAAAGQEDVPGSTEPTLSPAPSTALPPAEGAAVAAQLPSVAHDYPAAVLLIDTGTGYEAAQVVFVNDLARQLAPDLVLPAAVEDWSRAARLQAPSGTALSQSSTTLTQMAAGHPATGRQVSAALHSEATSAREALWAIGMPLHNATAPLRARSLLVLMPLRYPDAIADVQASAHAAAQATTTGRAHDAVLSSGLAMAISDATHPDDPLIWVSPSFEHLTGYTSAEVLGRNCRFLQGPGTDPATVAQMREGLAARETVSVTLLNYRHDGSAFYNHLVISPIFSADGTLTHHVSVQTDVTAQVVTTREHEAVLAEAERDRQAQAAARAAAEAAAAEVARFGRLLLSMSEALTATVTVEQIATTLTEVVAAELGAAGGGLLLANPARTHLDFVTLDQMPTETDTAWSRIAWDADAPLAAAVRTRQAVFYPDTTSMLAAHPSITAQAAVPVMGASANLPLLAGGDVLGAVFLYWQRPHIVLEHQQEVLSALARYAAQAVQRATLITERRSTAQVLQQSLLTRLPEPDHLELRARYVPAAADEHVGGDWYDAVVLPDGATTVVIGDVSGHDIAAAAQMGQLRGLLRAFAFDRVDPPAQIVGRLDRAVEGLHVNTLATLVLARIEQDEELEAVELRRLRWTNAGHPPPILLHTDGTTQVLETTPELLVGLIPDVQRSDHTQTLPPGSTLLLYTDGLIEHRGRTLDHGIADLRRVLSVCSGLVLEELLDRLVLELVGQAPEDDCAILAVRAHPEDRPRPAEAGPSRVA